MEQNNVDIHHQYQKTFIETFRPEDLEIRKQLDFGCSRQNNTAVMFEISSQWNKAAKYIEKRFAKIRYIKSIKEWELYWMCVNQKWELYILFPTTTNLQVLLKTIKEDAYFCFFG